MSSHVTDSLEPVVQLKNVASPQPPLSTAQGSTCVIDALLLSVLDVEFVLSEDVSLAVSVEVEVAVDVDVELSVVSVEESEDVSPDVDVAVELVSAVDVDVDVAVDEPVDCVESVVVLASLVGVIVDPVVSSCAMTVVV